MSFNIAVRGWNFVLHGNRRPVGMHYTDKHPEKQMFSQMHVSLPWVSIHSACDVPKLEECARKRCLDWINQPHSQLDSHAANVYSFFQHSSQDCDILPQDSTKMVLHVSTSCAIHSHRICCWSAVPQSNRAIHSSANLWHSGLGLSTVKHKISPCKHTHLILCLQRGRSALLWLEAG